MPVSEEYKLWSRVVIGLALSLAVLIILAVWSTVDYIDDKNDADDKNLARDVGLYIMCTLGGLLTCAMVFCAITVNQPHLLQIFAGLAFAFGVLFLSVSVSQVQSGDNNAVEQRFLAFGFLIGIDLLVGCCAAFRLSKIRDFDPKHGSAVVREAQV